MAKVGTQLFLFVPTYINSLALNYTRVFSFVVNTQLVSFLAFNFLNDVQWFSK